MWFIELNLLSLDKLTNTNAFRYVYVLTKNTLSIFICSLTDSVTYGGLHYDTYYNMQMYLQRLLSNVLDFDL